MRESPGPRCLRAPRLCIPLGVWQKMMAYIVGCQVEINGFGYVSLVGDAFLITDVFITKQVASAAEVEADQLAIAEHMEVMRRENRPPSELRFQWHSHVNMPAYFSPTDAQNIENWAGPWLISLVANKRGEYSCQLDILGDIRVSVELQPELLPEMADELLATARQEIADKVRIPTGFMRRSKSAIDDQTSPDGLIGIRPEGFVQPEAFLSEALYDRR